MELIKSKEPEKDSGFVFFDIVDSYNGIKAKRYISNDGVVVISAVEAPEPDTIGAEYHVSISKKGKRISLDEALIVVAQFGMINPDEDNHINGIARHFWEPVRNDLKGYVCPCKRNEHAITEGDYVYRPIKSVISAKARE